MYGLGAYSRGILTTPSVTVLQLAAVPDAQAIKDHETYLAQHQAALDAIAARQAGDFKTYSDAIARLYSLGIQNASAADNAALQAIANEAAVNAAKAGLTGFAGALTGTVGLALLGLGALWLLSKRR